MIAAMTTTTRLLEGLHDPAAQAVWQAFDERYRPILVGFARHLGLNEEDAADVAQETLVRFVEGYRAGKYDRRRGRLRSWMIGIAKHLVADLRASKAKRREMRGASAILDLPGDQQLTAIWESRRQAEILARAMAELRDKTRTSERSIRAFEMVVFEGRSPEKVAVDLGMTRHDVYVAKHRVTEHLRDIVARLEVLYDGED